VGLYGQELPNQNGAPLRLIVPWIRLQEHQINREDRVWREGAGFELDETGAAILRLYSNVNPDRPNRRIAINPASGASRILMRKTLLFNGYAEQVAPLYANMDLRKSY
jgi:sulfoxide reductase catalytic subunit YedY